MKCSSFEARINEMQSNSVDKEMRNAMLEHKKVCVQCANSLELQPSYVALLSNWKEPKLSDTKKLSFLSLLENKENPAKRSARKSPYLGFASGFIVASLFASTLFIGEQLIQRNDIIGKNDIAYLLDDGGYINQEITLVIHASNDIPDAELQLSLPVELSVLGNEYLSEVKLPVNLKKGRNTIVIPVQLDEIALYSETLVVDASLIHKNGKQEFSLDLDKHTELDSPNQQSDELILKTPKNNFDATV